MTSSEDPPPSVAFDSFVLFLALVLVLVLAFLNFLASPDDCFCFRVRILFRLGLLLLFDVGTVDVGIGGGSSGVAGGGVSTCCCACALLSLLLLLLLVVVILLLSLVLL